VTRDLEVTEEVAKGVPLEIFILEGGIMAGEGIYTLVVNLVEDQADLAEGQEDFTQEVGIVGLVAGEEDSAEAMQMPVQTLKVVEADEVASPVRRLLPTQVREADDSKMLSFNLKNG